MEKTQTKTIKDWMNVSLELLRKPVYWGPLLITLLCTYGFFITHYAVGIDDTAMNRYFMEGLAPAQGRWVIFLVNKLIPLIYFTPFLTDFLGVLFLAFFAVLFSGFWQMLSDGRMKIWMLSVVACLIVSSPITSEVFVYYLHNGVGVGYVLTLMATFFLYRTCNKGIFTKQVIRDLACAAGLLTVALGLYESFEVA
nr:glucosyltransferase domain-containing protein [Lachnospiraceae bacterium]